MSIVSADVKLERFRRTLDGFSRVRIGNLYNGSLSIPWNELEAFENNTE
jgi:hypothetical protein